MTRESSKHFIVAIDATFGSAFQSETAQHSLEGLLRSWAEFYRGKHKNTKIIVTFTPREK